ncbi:MAG: response regulator [Trueperaceae bacterium]|nr:response regulator [Trueperaceae bacterium]
MTPTSEPTRTILVADDQEGQRVLIDMLLSLEGYRLVAVEDGREALAWLKENTPDLVVLDVNMPYVDGIDVCRRMKGVSRLAEVPVVVLTAMRDEGTEQAVRAAGADVMVRKPLEGKDFRKQVSRLLSRREDGDDADGA